MGSAYCCEQEIPRKQVFRRKVSNLYVDSGLKDSPLMPGLKEALLNCKSSSGLSLPLNPSQVKGLDATYLGQVDYDGLPDGVGEVLSRNYYMCGEFRNGLTHGLTQFVTADSRQSFAGRTQRGLPTEGVFANGSSIYEGDFRQGKAEGKGELASQNGTFKGVFSQGYFDKGEYYWPAKEPTFKCFKGLLYDGALSGSIDYKDGGKFRGECDYVGLRNGRYQYPNGDWYQGSFENGLREGAGIYYYSKDKVTYKGGFHLNEKEGKGIIVLADGSEHEGEWRAGQLVL